MDFLQNYFAEQVWEAVSEGIILRSGLCLKAPRDLSKPIKSRFWKYHVMLLQGKH